MMPVAIFLLPVHLIHNSHLHLRLLVRLHASATLHTHIHRAHNPHCIIAICAVISAGLGVCSVTYILKSYSAVSVLVLPVTSIFLSHHHCMVSARLFSLIAIPLFSASLAHAGLFVSKRHFQREEILFIYSAV
jgi:hypothetical protein